MDALPVQGDVTLPPMTEAIVMQLGGEALA